MLISHSDIPSSSAPKPVDTLFGECQFYYQRHNFSHALEQANLAVASYPRFLPALVEKMRVQLALQDWDQAVETAQRLGGTPLIRTPWNQDAYSCSKIPFVVLSNP